MTYLLAYDYVEDILERRDPIRPDHLAHIRAWKDDGRLAMAGAVGDPPTGGLFVFEVDDPAAVEEFADADPYVQAGLVTARRIQPWKLV
jgi:uncharacterized protein